MYVIIFFFLKINYFLCKTLLDPVFPVIAIQHFDFKNSFIAIKLFLIMILNLYLTSAWFLSKSDFVVAVLQRGQSMPISHKVVGFFRVFLKWSQWSCKTTPFLPCQKQLCSQWLVSVHISLHANEHCSPRLSLLWKWSSLSFNFLTKPALNCPSFRKQSGVKWFAQPGINELMKVKWRGQV